MRYLFMGLLLLTACNSEVLKSKKQRALDSAAAVTAADTTTAVTVSPNYYIDSVVTWTRLEEIMRHDPDGILAVQQTHSLGVSVKMRNGMQFKSKQPAIDEILKLLREVDPAGRILIATE